MIVTLPGQAFTSGSGNSGTASAQTAGTAFNLTLTAVQSDGVTIDTGYSGTKTISYSGPGGSPTYTTSVNFTSGQATGVPTTLTLAQTTTITATDGTLTGIASSSLLVNPGAINSYTVSASAGQTVGVPFSVTVTAKDANNNTVTTDSSTVATMTSASGNVQFDSNGDSTFGDNTKALSTGALTISAKNSTAETTTIIATDANTKTGTSGSITFNPVAQYRSKQSGNWNDFNTWQLDAGSGFVDAASGQTPSFADDTIMIRNGHTVAITASVAVDQVTIESGGQVTMSSAFIVNNGTGADIVVQSGGVLALAVNSTPPSFNSGATASIEGGGVLRVAGTGMTGNGTGVNSANFDYLNGAILDYSLTSNFSSSGVTYFPNADANTIPVFQLTGALTGSPGGSGATVVNGVFEVSPGNLVTWTGTGAKTFRNGIRGSGSMSQGTAGQFVISGATADLGGAGTLTLGANGLQISSASVTALSSDKSVAGAGAITIDGTLDLNSKTLTTATAPVFSGALIVQIDKTVTVNNSKLVLSSGALAYDGTLTVENLGIAPTGGEVFDLFDAPAFSGAFSDTNLPSLGAGLSWRTDTLMTTGSIKVNQAPVATSDAAGAVHGATITIAIAKLLANDTDPDGDPMTITAASATSGSASVVGDNVQYTAPASGTSDTITYTVSDGFGGTANGTILVTLTSGNSQGFNQLALPENIGGNTWRLSYLGIPGTNYALDWRTNLTLGDWMPVKTNPASASGQLLFTNTSTEPVNLYRTRYVP